MAVITKKQLLEAGVHFGHNTRRWNPKMKEYIYEERNGIYIIDLTKTEQLVEDAYQSLFTIVQNGGKVIFVGTRKQTQDVIKEEAIRSEMYYVDQRWLGGTLTNFKTIRKSIARLYKLEEMSEDGTFERLPKKEVILLKKEKEKLDRNLGGIKTMTAIPQAMVVVDPKTEHNAVAEARKLGIPIFGLVDTNCDPDEVDYVIPANDDAIRSVKLIVATLANAVVEANGGTPIEIVFTDEPVAEEVKPHRFRDGKRGKAIRSYYRQRREPAVQVEEKDTAASDSSAAVPEKDVDAVKEEQDTVVSEKDAAPIVKEDVQDAPKAEDTNNPEDAQ